MMHCPTFEEDIHNMLNKIAIIEHTLWIEEGKIRVKCLTGLQIEL